MTIKDHKLNLSMKHIVPNYVFILTAQSNYVPKIFYWTNFSCVKHMSLKSIKILFNLGLHLTDEK